MDTKTSYEILIAEKAKQLPVPDMADAIWAAIGQQLDAQNATDAEGHSISQKLPAKGFSGIGKTWWIIIAVVVLIVLIVIGKQAGNKNQPGKKKNEPAIEQRQQIQEKIPGSGTVNDSPREKQTQSLPAVNDKKIINTGEADNVFPEDSIIAPPVAAPAKELPVVNDKDIPLPDSVGIKQPPPKKPRGVKGINESDYKIIGIKKDSVKKGE